MRQLLLAVPFALLPLLSYAHEHEHEHGSLGAHEHGSAQLDVALDGPILEVQLHSPAMNLLGFEHAAQSAEDQATLSATHKQLEQPLQLFGLNGGDCQVSQQQLYSPLFAAEDNDAAHAHKHEHEHEHEHAAKGEHGGHEHSDIQANYRFTCKQPEQLKQLDLAPLFKRFPATQKIQVQLIGPNGQQGKQLSAAEPTLSF
ncbi:DUF2796 domain-containing protein [Pseudomonas sp. 5P_3.1_Bac2]|uniref:DUF2796 domain-containing protein n=1 Tax=Pseudomonas sp. 5P_3.1_Bac2 TaxID=2971617 RepID=UPI0021C97352|nr:DUF2796 domain-containing protein [Pseudomonas sp. 5P_3.1_Bac2]MCU1719335.1 DUF2796 domain-containing protein [Pseudomonas sp. 5P_3.1_Bac2]